MENDEQGLRTIATIGGILCLIVIAFFVLAADAIERREVA